MRKRKEYLNLLAYFMKLEKKVEDSEKIKLELKKLVKERLLEILASKNKIETINDVNYIIDDYDMLFEEAYNQYLDRKKREEIQKNMQKNSKSFAKLIKNAVPEKRNSSKDKEEITTKSVERIDFAKKMKSPIDYVPVDKGRLVLKEEKKKDEERDIG